MLIASLITNSSSTQLYPISEDDATILTLKKVPIRSFFKTATIQSKATLIDMYNFSRKSEAYASASDIDENSVIRAHGDEKFETGEFEIPAVDTVFNNNTESAKSNSPMFNFVDMFDDC